MRFATTHPTDFAGGSLSYELIALDQWTNSDTPILYGAVTTGNDWRFGEFHRQKRQIIQDIKLYRVPEELEILIGILIGLLSYSVPSL